MAKNEAAKLPMERWEEALLEAAFTEILLEECQALEQSTPTVAEAALLRRAEEKLPEQLDMLARSIRRPNPIVVLWRKSGAALKYVALLLLAVTVSLGTALAFHDGFRARVVEFLTDLTDDYVSVGMTKERASLNRPEGWLAPYFPAYIPEGYVLNEYSSNTNNSWLDYVNEANQHIFIQISTSNLNSYLNNAGAEYKVIPVNNSDAISWTSNNIYYVARQQGNQVICVSATDVSLCLAVINPIN